LNSPQRRYSVAALKSNQATTSVRERSNQSE